MSKLTKFIYASDNHGDMGDPEALAALERRPDPIAEAQALGVPPEVIAAMLRMRDQQRF